MYLSETVLEPSSALSRIVAGLFAMLGLTEHSAPGRIARSLHRTIARALRPAESAVRRLIVFLAAGLKAKPQPLRAMPSGLVRTGQAQSVPAFQLFDPRPPLLRPRRRPQTAQPRISFLCEDEVRTISFASALQPAGDGLENASRLARRLLALESRARQSAASGQTPRGGAGPAQEIDTSRARGAAASRPCARLASAASARNRCDSPPLRLARPRDLARHVLKSGPPDMRALSSRTLPLRDRIAAPAQSRLSAPLRPG